MGTIIDVTGEIRPSFWFLAVLVGLPAPIIYFVNVERGKRDGERLAEVIEGFKSREDSRLSSSHDGEENQGMLAGGDENGDGYTRIP